MTCNRQKYHAIVAAIVAAVLVLPAPLFAQTAPAPTVPQATQTMPQEAPVPAAPTPSMASPAPSADPVAAPAAPSAVDSSAAAPVPNSPDIALKLPRDLSPWGMFMAADIVVKAVMIGLAFASVLTWTIWFAKAMELMTARRRMRAEIVALGEVRSWSDVAAFMNGRGNGTAALLRAADAELRLS